MFTNRCKEKSLIKIIEKDEVLNINEEFRRMI
jgi:hypothetical protein